MQFKVPQFLEIEDKIFGPFTFKEFVYLAGGAGACYALYKMLGLLIGIIPILIVAGIAGALTFYHPNSKQSLLNIIEAAFKYASQNKLYIWKRHKNTKKPAENLSAGKIDTGERNESRLGTSKLRDLAWSLDVLDLKKENK